MGMMNPPPPMRSWLVLVEYEIAIDEQHSTIKIVSSHESPLVSIINIHAIRLPLYLYVIHFDQLLKIARSSCMLGRLSALCESTMLAVLAGYNLATHCQYQHQTVLGLHNNAILATVLFKQSQYLSSSCYIASVAFLTTGATKPISFSSKLFSDTICRAPNILRAAWRGQGTFYYQKQLYLPFP